MESAEPYVSAGRVFWIVDDGGIHRGQTSIDPLEGRWGDLKYQQIALPFEWKLTRDDLA